VCPDKKITDLLLSFQDASLSFRTFTRRMSEMGINLCEFELQVNSFCWCALAMTESNDIVCAQLVTPVKMTVPCTVTKHSLA
jgi:hypothetical protein